MSLLERPNLISLLILGGVVLIAGGYGLITYTQGPELEHYAVDPDHDFGFDFERPDNFVKLPRDLMEISGIAGWFVEDDVVAVQDEDGELFIVDTQTGNVKSDFKFGKDRDYEGIARVDSTIYVLERDGDIHQVKYIPGKESLNSDKIETDFSYRNDTEGICYDERTKSLLIVPKEQELNPQDDDDYRHGVYAVDLATGLMEPQPRFFIDEFAIGEAVYGKQRPYSMKPSGVAVDPLTGHIFVIASVGNIMVEIDRESDIKHIELLKERTLTQPEGITFNSAGDLFISSEGRGGKAVIVTFRRIKKGGKAKPAQNKTDE